MTTTNKILPKCNTTLNVIVGIDKNGGIGFQNKVLFDCPKDKLFYEEKTENSIVIMGRGTFESLQNKIMPNRLNIVISSTLSNKDYPQYGSDVLLIFSDFIAVIDDLNRTKPACDVYIVGGESIYKWFLENDYVDYIYINVIDKQAKSADRFFPSSLYKEKYNKVYSKKHTWIVDSVDTTVYEEKYIKI